MNIKCCNVTAKYPINIKQHIYNLKNHLRQHPAVYQDAYPLFDFSCNFKQGVSIILGPNSSGKSTLLRILAGILQPVSGAVYLDEQKISHSDYRHLISYLPQVFDLYPNFTAYEMLEYISLLKGIKHYPSPAVSIKRALLAVNLLNAADQKIKTYSRGMLERLGIAQALLNDTPVVILDEPTASLDPEEKDNFHHLVRKLGQTRSILFSSSILADIICADTAVILKNGRCCFYGTPSDLAAYGTSEKINEPEHFNISLQKGYQLVLKQVNN